MNIQAAYNSWARTYDTVLNPTRDLEGQAIRQLLTDVAFAEVLEIGCGTGKNTAWLAGRATHVTAIDFSGEMLNYARQKITAPHVSFQQADLTANWSFVRTPPDLITTSLVLEHIQDLDFVFRQAGAVLRAGGFFYIGELHPFKQYQGSKARFETGNGVFELDCFVHHVSDYTEAARKNGFQCLAIRELFDHDNPTAVPRIISFLFRADPR